MLADAMMVRLVSAGWTGMISFGSWAMDMGFFGWMDTDILLYSVRNTCGVYKMITPREHSTYCVSRAEYVTVKYASKMEHGTASLPDLTAEIFL